MDNVREVITFQFGNYANYVGTHFWNIQESGFTYKPSAVTVEWENDVNVRLNKLLAKIDSYIFFSSQSQNSIVKE